jgi:mono/diheme cytochrome c family protein
VRDAAARAAVVLALLLGGCGDQPASPPQETGSAPAPANAPAPPNAPAAANVPASASPSAAAGSAAKGKQVWLGQCIACHNPDPTKDGPVGPAVKGSSRDLLEARVVRGGYPAGYMPKRPTKVMPPRPDLAPSVSDLAAYLH